VLHELHGRADDEQPPRFLRADGPLVGDVHPSGGVGAADQEGVLSGLSETRGPAARPAAPGRVTERARERAPPPRARTADRAPRGRRSAVPGRGAPRAALRPAARARARAPAVASAARARAGAARAARGTRARARSRRPAPRRAPRP